MAVDGFALAWSGLSFSGTVGTPTAQQITDVNVDHEAWIAPKIKFCTRMYLTFVMPTLFLCSGEAVGFSLRVGATHATLSWRRLDFCPFQWWLFALTKGRRLLVPFAVGYLFFVVPKFYVSRHWHDDPDAFPTDFFEYSGQVVRTFRGELGWMWFLPFLWFMHTVNFHTVQGRASEGLFVSVVWSAILGSAASFGGSHARSTLAACSFLLPYLARFLSLSFAQTKRHCQWVTLVFCALSNLSLSFVFSGLQLDGKTCEGPWMGYCVDPRKMSSLDFVFLLWIGYNHYYLAGYNLSCERCNQTYPSLTNISRGVFLFLIGLFSVILSASDPVVQHDYLSAWVWTANIRLLAAGIFPSSCPTHTWMANHIHTSALYIYVAHFFFIDVGALLFVWNIKGPDNSHIAWFVVPILFASGIIGPVLLYMLRLLIASAVDYLLQEQDTPSLHVLF
eukprot:CAMPEP_0169428204 /NCGR_PEP_ID=MMETSP1042-20121227/1201_1 /TAXON_ID=464988 /ORGANISM="Hemiselmis andersenii, Strain CCMP1180" /LENGTH=447 /DNA_ID=CAMNT_0009538357 /DNA_START=134 /DNA_END=1478 /DNA_ORIENTATION=-